MDEIRRLIQMLEDARSLRDNLQDRKSKLQERRQAIIAELDQINVALATADADITAARAALKAAL